MALRCSLLGHDYGETEVEREREERGSEVVVTVEEYEECARCGDRNVISENTEVTSLSAATDADSLPPESELETAPTDSGADTVEPDPPADDAVEIEDTEDDAEFIEDDGTDEGEPVPDGVAADSDSAEKEVDVPTDENGDPVTDDGEILEDDEDDEDDPVDRDRDHGEWPETDDVGPPVGGENEPTDWPDDEDAAPESGAAPNTDLEEPIDADEEVTDDAVVLENDTDGGAESTAAADARSVTTEAPTADDTQGEGGDGQAPAGDGQASGTGIARAAAATAPGQNEGPREDVPTEFYCPQCEYVTTGDRGSLRAGDICPECKKGYIGERERR